MARAKRARTIFLHIGTEKTGTTTFQEFCALNRPRLEALDILYPATPGRKNHVKLAVYAGSGSRTQDLRAAAEIDPAQGLDAFRLQFELALAQEIDGCPCSKILLSNEHLSSRLRSADEIHEVSKLLLPFADEIKVVVYVRRQHELFLSSYSTAITSGADFDPSPPKSPNDPYFNYGIMLAPWEEVFGRGNLVLRVFERSRLIGNSIVPDLLSILNCPSEAGFEFPKDTNVRLSHQALQFLRVFNRHVPFIADGKLNPDRGDIGLALSGASSGPGPTLDSEILAGIDELYAASNREVAARYLEGASGLFGPAVYADRPPPEALDLESAVAIAAALWRHKQRQLLRARKQNETLRSKRCSDSRPRSPARAAT